MRSGVAWVIAWALFASMGLSCGEVPQEPLACLPDVQTDCQPLYAPTFDEVFERTLKPTCAQPGGSCHAAAGARGGLVFEDRAESYDLLVGAVDGRLRVDPDDLACSTLLIRLDATDPSDAMPPGKPLSAEERCAIRQWVASGADP